MRWLHLHSESGLCMLEALVCASAQAQLLERDGALTQAQQGRDAALVRRWQGSLQGSQCVNVAATATATVPRCR